MALWTRYSRESLWKSGIVNDVTYPTPSPSPYRGGERVRGEQNMIQTQLVHNYPKWVFLLWRLPYKITELCYFDLVFCSTKIKAPLKYSRARFFHWEASQKNFSREIISLGGFSEIFLTRDFFTWRPPQIFFSREIFSREGFPENFLTWENFGGSRRWGCSLGNSQLRGLFGWF